MKAIILIPILLVSWKIQAQKEFVRQKLGDHINTEYTETKPIISHDNSILYLTRQYYPENLGGKKDIQDIYMATKDKELLWSKPINIGAPLNNSFPNGISSLSSSGDTALVINVYKEDKFENGVSRSYRSDGQWCNPVEVVIDGFKNKSDYANYFETADGSKLFLAIKGKDSYGDQDIYISTKIGDLHWSKPINIGRGVNTHQAEFSPFLSADNKTLFFSSYGHEGYGNADIFYSERLDDTWTNWSEAKNIGGNINTEGFEAYFTMPSSGQYAYFVSDMGSNGGSRDIFRGLIPLELNPTPGVIVSGITKNELTGVAMTAQVFVSSDNPNVDHKYFITDGDEHKYSRSIFEFPETFMFIAEQENYMATAQYLFVEYSDKRDIQVDLYLTPMEVGNSVVSHDVQFENGSSVLTDLGKNELTRMVNYLKGYENINFEIAAHVEKSGDAVKDKQLSFERLAKINSLFLENGINKNRFLARHAMGSSQPFQNTLGVLIHDPNNPNDRVSFTVYSDRDADNVPDGEDKCPDVAGPVANQGCKIPEEKVEVFTGKHPEIQFEIAQDIIKPESYQLLDIVIRLMKDNPQYYLKISGHTDNQGNQMDNQGLSERRARSTKNYLVGKGIEENRMKSYGFGETQPIATNETAEGRQQNRRIAFEVVYSMEEL